MNDNEKTENLLYPKKAPSPKSRSTRKNIIIIVIIAVVILIPAMGITTSKPLSPLQ